MEVQVSIPDLSEILVDLWVILVDIELAQWTLVVKLFEWKWNGCFFFKDGIPTDVFLWLGPGLELAFLNLIIEHHKDVTLVMA